MKHKIQNLTEFIGVHEFSGCKSEVVKRIVNVIINAIDQKVAWRYRSLEPPTFLMLAGNGSTVHLKLTLQTTSYIE